ncbi:hypothetical protein [Bradyrhizobium sp.]|uniref:hypothetical protein n=1 Tax=Bradyrhizobium sp. TaxID=376 RepID=UPI003C39A2D5
MILAIGLLAGLGVQSHATALAEPSADNQTGVQSQMTGTDQAAGPASDNDRTVAEDAPSAATSAGEAPAQAEAPAPALASSDDNSPSDTASLVGKIFIGVGTLLTLASAARMFFA